VNIIQHSERQKPSDAAVKSADGVLDVLGHLGHAQRPMPLAENAHETAFPKSSTFALPPSLLARGQVARDETERYALAEPFGRKASDRPGSVPRQVAPPVVQALVVQSQKTENLGVMRGATVRMLLQMPSPQGVRYEPRAVDCPACCIAMGRILLAYAPPRSLDACLAAPLAKLTPVTRTDPKFIRRSITTARGEDNAEIGGEHAEGGAGAAAPVFERAVHAIAALTTAGLAESWSRYSAAFTPALIEAARDLTRRIEELPPAGRN